MHPLIMYAINCLRIRSSVLQTILVVLFLGTGVLFFSTCYIPEAFGAGAPETQIFHEQLLSFFGGAPFPLKVAVTDPAGVTEVRCYFRFDRSAPFVYSEMVSAGNKMFTTKLPVAASTVKDVEYLFLVVNGQKQAILSKTFTLNKKSSWGRTTGVQNLAPERYQLKSDVEGADTVKESFLQPENVDLSLSRQQDRYGLLAGLYTREQIGLEVVEGYFGAFRFDSTKRMMAVKGSIVTRRALALSSSQEKSTVAKGTAGAKQVSEPQIAGSSWAGLFWRSDNYKGTVQPVTATVTQKADGKVSITTSLAGLGHSFEGEIYDGGHLLLYDAFDNEDWSTLDGPVTDLYIKIEDYVIPPYDECYHSAECDRPAECSDPDVFPLPDICNEPLPDSCNDPIPDECVHWPINIIELKRSTNERVPIGALLLLLSPDKGE